MARRVRQSDATPDDGFVEWPRPVYDRSWVDPEGITWRMRGRALGNKAARRLVRTPDLRTTHAYGVDVVQVDGERKDALLARVLEYLHGDAPPYCVFELGDFRDQEHRVMLMVQESC